MSCASASALRSARGARARVFTRTAPSFATRKLPRSGTSRSTSSAGSSAPIAGAPGAPMRMAKSTRPSAAVPCARAPPSKCSTRQAITPPVVSVLRRDATSTVGAAFGAGGPWSSAA